MSPALQKICSNTYTITNLHRRLGLLQECLEEMLYQEDQALDPLALLSCALKVGSEEDAHAIQQWGMEVYGGFNRANLVAQISDLKHEVASLPFMTLYVPVHFDADASALVGEWCRKNIDGHLMLELIVDPSVTGGCAFAYNDAYHDLSLLHAMEKHRGVVTELISSYA